MAFSSNGGRYNQPSSYDLFRGETMNLCQIYFQSEVAYSCVSQLGEMAVVQFIDMNSTVNAFQRKFVNDVRRCEEMERKIRYIEKEITKETDIVLQEADETCDAPKPKDMIALETKLDQLEHDLLEVNTNKDQLRKNFLELIELKHILNKAAHFFEEVDNYNVYNNPRRSHNECESDVEHVSLLMSDQRSHRQSIGFLAGIMHRDKIPAFELMLWRFCRGNVFIKTAEIEELVEDSQTNTFEPKSVFMIFFQGEQLKQKCKKICDGFKATIYPCPETQSERREMLNGVTARLDELKTVLDQSLVLRKSLLITAAQNLKTWFCKVRKMKAIYHTMNMFKFDQKSMIAECWIPTSEIAKIKEALDKETKKIDANFQTIINIVHTKQTPPTFHRTNKFTYGFQNIINAYGVPSYREINPMPFTVITFPFLFALMFGDAGHATIMLVAALFMVRKENWLKKSVKGNEIMEIFFGGRYIILLMAVFSVYTGLIYNDAFSKSINIFQSQWRVNVPESIFNSSSFTQITLNPDPNEVPLNKQPKMYSGVPYAFGLDPVWQFAINKISFTNTMKMKFSIIIGIMQMCFGLILGLLNHIYFKRRISILFEFIPQIVFIALIFVYLCMMIFIKWIKFEGSDDPVHGACGPNLLIELINMFFFKDSTVLADSDNHDYCKQLYPGQVWVQRVFVVVAVVCIPVMLFTKPLILFQRHKNKSKMGRRFHNTNGMAHTNPLSLNMSDEDMKASNGHSSSTNIVHISSDEEEEVEQDEHEGEFEFGEVFVEQTIHTIEYFLGCVSHTASYLRLWALSLAHAELSEVLWSMLFRIGLKTKPPVGAIMLVPVFAAFAGVSVGILCVMEGLSAFLHALRLHWVEFQSKFYKGEGYEFVPFSFEAVLNIDND